MTNNGVCGSMSAEKDYAMNLIPERILPRLSILPIVPILPVLIGMMWTALHAMQTSAEASWPAFAWLLAQLLLEFAPLFLAQWLQFRAPWRWRHAVWLLGMVLYPLANLTLQGHGGQPLCMTQSGWLIALSASLAYWAHQFYQSRPWPDHSRASLRKLWSLDTTVLLLLATWVLFMSALLTSHQNAMALQPIPLAFHFDRILRHPAELIACLLQFTLMASIIYLIYWTNRYILIRHFLAHHGPLPFVLLSLAALGLSYPLLATLVLQLPLNVVETTLLPSGNHNPFDWFNLMFMLWIWALSTPLILAFERQQQEQSLAEARQAQLQTELRLLQQQINPHFLFNTLNNLYALCLIQSADAPKLVLQLANLLRYVVYQGQQALVSLQQEISYLEDYLALQQLRVSNKTRLLTHFPDAPGPYRLPPLLLIMLVENAYKHGVESTAEKSTVEIEMHLQGKQLRFVCRNSLGSAAGTAQTRSVAPAAQQDERAASGLGLKNLRRRLQLHYGQRYTLRSAPDEHGWCAELTLELAQ
ncbi:MAG: Sensor histidine kinase YpdA [Pseudomonadota bacterium]